MSAASPARQLSLFDRPAIETPATAPPSPPEPSRLPGGPAPDRQLLLDGCGVRYELRRARRRTIGFVVGAEGVRVSAPRWVSIADIEAAMREKAAWILRALADGRERARRLEAARIAWGDGASVPFLGGTLRLVLDPAAVPAALRPLPGAAPTAPPRAALHLALPRAAAPAQIRDAVQAWLQQQARRVFDERCAIYAPRLRVRMTRLRLSSASTRWGSASADGSIRLNWRLIHFSLPVIDYVVAHELAHLREMNHSARFWDAVRSVLPGFEAARELLRDPALPSFE